MPKAKSKAIVVAKTRQQIIKDIPVNQSAKATERMKNYWILKLTQIHERRNRIDQGKRQQEHKAIIDAYKHSVGFDKATDELFNLRRHVKAAEDALVKLGLTEDGSLLDVATKDRYNNPGYFIVAHRSSGEKFVPITKKEYDGILDVQKRIHAVHAEMEILTDFELLESRLIMAQTIGEIELIVNALVDQDVFDVDSEKVFKQLTNGDK